ncbi:hypothetical protein PV08_01704 [Exophiala spinifera]|uniref:Uncharacterized protein n=1 Tax=Exophiala spinifera TaxID=91928 RepID=A0A0D2CCB1_9EURO|nr:uncharacterized protein PV08_01704 [Exophiala spinifera]KIW21124.1 hypothetical protein PV08_01704 [Exophiala spinifera]
MRCGKRGYEDAVSDVYQIFGCDETDEDSLKAAKQPSLPRPPQYNAAAQDPIADTVYRDQVIGNLWERCKAEQDGTFGALHAFSCYWCGWFGYEIPEDEVPNMNAGGNAVCKKEMCETLIPPSNRQEGNSKDATSQPDIPE